MKKIKYENVNEIRRNGCFTNSGFKTFSNMMVGRVACSNYDRDGKEVTKFFDVVQFRDKTTGQFPFEDLFKGGKKVVFTGRFNTREHNGRQYDEIIVTEMHENVGVEVEVDDEPKKAPARPGGPFDPAKGAEPADMSGIDVDDDLPGNDLPAGFEDLQGADDMEF